MLRNNSGGVPNQILELGWLYLVELASATPS